MLHLQDLQKQQMILTQAADPSMVNKFKAGFTECAAEVGRFGGLDPLVKRRLLQHLSNCLTGVKPIENTGPVHILPSPPSSPDQTVDKIGERHPVMVVTAAAAPSGPSQGGQSFNHTTLPSDGYFLTNGNGGVGVQLIPTKLPNGNIAFVVPPNGLKFQTPAQASIVAVQQQQSNTPLPMLIPIPNRQQTVANSASPDISNSSTGNSSMNSTSSHSSLARSANTSPQHHLYHMQQVTSSPYDRRTPSSSYGSMDSQTMSPPHSPQSTSSGTCQGPPHKRARNSTDNCDIDMEERESECHSPGPLSLVVRKRSNAALEGDDDSDTEKQCWRPW